MPPAVPARGPPGQLTLEPSPNMKDEGSELLWIPLVLPQIDKVPLPRLSQILPGGAHRAALGPFTGTCPAGGWGVWGSEAAWSASGRSLCLNGNAVSKAWSSAWAQPAWTTFQRDPAPEAARWKALVSLPHRLPEGLSPTRRWLWQPHP